MKKLLSLSLAVLLVLFMCPPAFAISAKITGVIKPIDTNDTTSSTGAGSFHPGNVLTLRLTADMFKWDDNVSRPSGEVVTLSDLSRADISIRTTDLDKNIMEITLDELSRGGQAYVKVKFAESYRNTKSKKFKTTVYLAISSTRQTDSKIVLEGTFGLKEVSISSSSSITKLLPDTLYKATETMQNAEFDLDQGIIIKARMYKNTSYYAAARDDLQASDDRLLTRYDGIYAIVAFDTLGFTDNANTKVSLVDYDGDYVYNANGEYIGRAPRDMGLSTRYYISDTRYDNLNAILSPSSSSTSTSSSASSSSTAPSTPSASGGTNAPNTPGGAITSDAAKTQTAAAVQSAKSSGLATATVRFKDMSSISAAALKESAKAASGLKISLIADTMSGASVVGRITINPALAANLTKDIKLGAYVDSANTSGVKTNFEKWFNNKVEVISLAQKEAFGMTVSIAAKVNLTNLNTKTLVFYSYDKSANKYTQLSNTAAFVDSANYLHFNTTLGGEILITDKALVRK